MDVEKQKIYSIPNLLSMTRLVLVPVLIGLAMAAKAQAFLIVLAVSLLSDVFDGYLARKLNQTTDLGAKLDSWGDVLTYGAMILGLYWIWPQVFAEQLWFLVAATLSFVVPVAHALKKFGEYPSYHTLGAKTAAVLMAPAFYSLTLLGWDLFFQAVIIFHIVVAFEEMAITSVLSRPRTDVMSILSLGRYPQVVEETVPEPAPELTPETVLKEETETGTISTSDSALNPTAKEPLRSAEKSH
jgi:phosphatidylglycerophosphate synthase